MLLILSTIAGLENDASESGSVTLDDIHHISGHDPYHGHSEPCQNTDHAQHVCHFGHCACIIYSVSEIKSENAPVLTQKHGLGNQTVTSFDHGRSLFRPPIFNA